MNLVIKRSKWLRGGRDGWGCTASSSLMNSYGHMCCLGFLAKACGATDEQLLHKFYPMDAPELPWPESIRSTKYFADTELTSTIVMENDYGLRPEQTLTKLFATAGVAVTFED